MKNQLWLRLRSLLLLWACFAATTFAPPAVFAYDAQNQTTVAYDSSGESAVGYDTVSMLATDEKENGATGDYAPFAVKSETI